MTVGYLRPANIPSYRLAHDMPRIRTLALMTLTTGLLLVGCSSDDKTDSSSSDGGVTVTEATGGTKVDMVLSDTAGLDAPQTMTAEPLTAPAGKVTFTAKNTGTIEHEMVVLKTDTAPDQLAVDAEGKVSEDDSQGEIPEFPAGETKSVTLDLKPGAYVLVCNIAKHYGLGMRTGFTVS